MKNLKIAYKLIISFLAIATIAALIGIVGIVGLRQMIDSNSKMYQNQMIPFPYIADMVEDVSVLRAQAVTAALFYDDSSRMQTAESTIEETENNFKTNYDLYNPTITNPNSRLLFDEAKVIFDEKFIPVIKDSIDLSKNGKISDAKMLMDSAKAPADKLLQNLRQCMSNRIESAKILYDEANNLGKRLNIILICVISIGIVMSVLLGILLSSAISKPINQMAVAAKSIAEGHLDVNTNYVSKDEIGSLANSLSSASATLKLYIQDISNQLQAMSAGDLSKEITQNYIGDFTPIKQSMIKMSNEVSKTLYAIHLSSEQVSSGAEQVSIGAQSLSQGATEQASSAEELTASISEISDKVRQTAENVSEALVYVREAGEGVQYSNAQMESMLRAMDEINISSSEIGKIIKTIDDIAFQTNILALNAAVEAARAGAAGKGFAVVADEVRNLSSKSAEAAKQTTNLIQNSIERVKSGSKIADETAKALANVLAKSHLVTQAIEKITLASNEQSTTISQIVEGVEQISAVVQTNSATAEESAAASEELSGQATILRDEIKKFKLKNDANSFRNSPENDSFEAFTDTRNTKEHHAFNSKY